MLEKQINQDIKESILRHQSEKLEALRFIKTAIQVEKAKNGLELLTDEQVIKVVQKLVSQSNESALQYENGNRSDLAEHEKVMIDMYNTYLPEQLSIDQITEKITEIITELGAITIRDMGKVMKKCTEVFAGTADNKTIGSIVKTKLS